MLTVISLRNFQCHRELEVRLSRVTVLVGPNDAGKSAVLRALRWVMLNEWEGRAGEQVTWGEGECSVSLGVDGHTVARGRKGDTNLYSLDEENSHKAFGGRVPDDIAALLRAGPDNFQGQHDPAYWLSLTSGQAAAALNGIFSLSKVDDALSQAASRVREAKARARVSGERLAALRGRKRALAWVTGADKALRGLESLGLRLEGLRLEEGRLVEAVRVLTEAERERAGLLARRGLLASLLALAEGLVPLGRDVELLTGLVREEERCQKLRQTLAERRARLTGWMAGACPLCGRG